MDNSISLFARTGYNPYIRAQEVRPAASATRPAAAAPANLSQVEQKMIEEFFPASPSLEMKLYGPGRDVRSVAPASVGRTLDLRG